MTFDPIHEHMEIKSNNFIYQDLEHIRDVNPVVHNVTNLVTMSTIANVLLALGASPIMAHAKDELTEIIKLANALVVNIGTLDAFWIEAIQIAQNHALMKKIPIIFDPVGVGASKYRTETAKIILNRGVNIIRGNASEIISLIDNEITTKGVDSQHESKNAVEAAKLISKTYNCVVVISGESDIVISNDKLAFIDHGTSLFTKVTGMGCAVTAVIGAFAAINSNYFLAATHAMSVFCRAGEIAASRSRGCGSFHLNLLDALSTLQKEDLSSLKIKNISPC